MNMKKLYLQIFILASLMTGLGIGFFVGRKTYTDPIKYEYKTVYATYKGGEVKAKDVNETIHGQVLSLPKRIYEEKKRATLKIARSQILHAEAKKRNVKYDELINKLQKEHKDDPVTTEEFTIYIKSHGIREDKITKEEREKLMKLIQRHKTMRIEERYADDIIKNANIQLSIPL